MRDLERWKDKVELSLDGRQIFFLFFGSAVAACLIFVAGVLIGKRLEARALALAPPPVEDPLAALDQLGEADDADDSLTYHKALTREPAHLKTADSAKLDVAKLVESAPVKAEAKPNDVKPAKPIDVKPVKPVDVALKPADATEIDATLELPRLPTLPAGKPQVVAAGKPQVVVAGKPQVVVAGKPQVVVAAPAVASAKKADGHFTLQLSAFPERSDAEEFMRKIQSAGYKPFLVVTEIPGKGVFYRVRVGDYANRDAAANAKSDFERKQRMVAYVAKL